MRRFFQFLRAHQAAVLAAAFALVVGTIVLSMQFQNRVDQRLAFIRNRGEPRQSGRTERVVQGGPGRT